MFTQAKPGSRQTRCHIKSILGKPLELIIQRELTDSCGKSPQGAEPSPRSLECFHTPAPGAAPPLSKSTRFGVFFFFTHFPIPSRVWRPLQPAASGSSARRPLQTRALPAPIKSRSDFSLLLLLPRQALITGSNEKVELLFIKGTSITGGVPPAPNKGRAGEAAALEKPRFVPMFGVPSIPSPAWIPFPHSRARAPAQARPKSLTHEHPMRGSIPHPHTTALNTPKTGIKIQENDPNPPLRVLRSSSPTPAKILDAKISWEHPWL